MEAIELGQQVVAKLASGELPEEALITLFITKVLGILIVLGACIVKLPQIINVWKSKSGEGLPLVSSELENYVYLIHVSYGIINGLSIGAYGEAAATWIQNLILLFLLYRYQKKSAIRAAGALAVVAGVLTPVYMGLISRPVIAKLYDMNSTIYLASKLPLIISAFQEGKTGQQSFLTNFLQLLGAVARVFTSIKEKTGMPMVRGFILGTAVNGTVTGQILYYGKDGRNAAAATAAAEKTKKDR